MGIKGSILCLLSLRDIKVLGGHSFPFWSLILGTTLTSGQPWESFSGSVCPNSWSIRWKHSCALSKASGTLTNCHLYANCLQELMKFWSNVQMSVYLTVYCICFCSAEPLSLPVNMDNDITDYTLIPLGSRTLSLSCTPHRCPKLKALEAIFEECCLMQLWPAARFHVSRSCFYCMDCWWNYKLVLLKSGLWATWHDCLSPL